MSAPAREALQRIREKHPFSQVVERTATSLTAAYGVYHRSVVTGPLMHFEEEGEWREIDTAWVPSSGEWQFEMRLAPYRAKAKTWFHQEDLIEYSTPNGESVRFQPSSLSWRDESGRRQQMAAPHAVATEAHDDVLSWPDAFGPGRSMRWTAHPGSLQKILELSAFHSMSPLAPYLSGEVSLELALMFKLSPSVTAFVDGVAWDRQHTRTTESAIEFRNDSGELLWSFAAPTAWDSAGNTVQATMSIDVAGNNLRLSVGVPRSWLMAAQYPVMVDPEVIVGSSTTSDSWVWLNGNDTATAATIANSLGNVNSTTIRNGVFGFYGINIPAGVTIDSAACLWSPTSGANSTIPCLLRCSLLAADNAELLRTTSDVATLLALPRTTTSLYDVPAFVVGQSLQVPDFLTMFREVVYRPGWSYNGSVALFIQDEGSALGANRTVSLTGMSAVYITADYGLPEPSHYVLDGTLTSWLYAPSANLVPPPGELNEAVQVRAEMLVSLADWAGTLGVNEPMIGQGVVETEENMHYSMGLRGQSTERIPQSWARAMTSSTTFTNQFLGPTATSARPAPGTAVWVALTYRYSGTGHNAGQYVATDPEGVDWYGGTATGVGSNRFVPPTAADTRIGMRTLSAGTELRMAMKVYAARLYYSTSTTTNQGWYQVANADFRVSDQSTGDSFGVLWLNAGGATYVQGAPYTPTTEFFLSLDGTISSSGITNELGTDQDLHLSAIDLGDDGSTRFLTDDRGGSVTLSLSNLPVDFVSMYRLKVQLRTRKPNP
jgi:hypothetical protein